MFVCKYLVISNVIVDVTITNVNIIIFKFCGVTIFWRTFTCLRFLMLYEQVGLSNETSSAVLSHGSIYLVRISNF